MAFSRKGQQAQAVSCALVLLIFIWLFVPFQANDYYKNMGSSGVAGPVRDIPGLPLSFFNSTSAEDQNVDSSANKDEARPLILYNYAESTITRDNLNFFIHKGLHSAADFLFILNDVENPSSLEIPKQPNIYIHKRGGDCSNVGAYGDVLRQGGLSTRYSRFIMLNATLRGPFVPHWSRGCWSDQYLERLTGKTKLVGMTGNCKPKFHVQSHLWVTDTIGLSILLNPPAAANTNDTFVSAAEPEQLSPIGLAGCYGDADAAAHAELGATVAMRHQGYDVDVMMTAFRKSPWYIDECGRDEADEGDFLWEGKYFGSNIHPYETLFIRTDRDIDPRLIQHLTEWHEASGTNSWGVCKRDSSWD